MRFNDVLKFLCLIALTVLGIPFFSEELFARAGGGGGGSHGGGSHSGGSGHSSGGSSGWGHSSGGGVSHGTSYGGSSHFDFSSLFTLIILIALLYLLFRVILFFKKGSIATNSSMVSNEKKSVEQVDGWKEFSAANPNFDLSEFLMKVNKAFIEVQTSWSEQNMNHMRRFITDGVYQRFNTQFKMMKLLQQTNPLSNINIANIWIDRIEQDGLYDIMQVGVEASMDDTFECALNHNLDEEGSEDFVEFWSFIRKRGVPKKDIYDSDKCPNCGAPLPENIGEVCKCMSIPGKVCQVFRAKVYHLFRGKVCHFFQARFVVST